jgi:hypothetical protein
MLFKCNILVNRIRIDDNGRFEWDVVGASWTYILERGYGLIDWVGDGEISFWIRIYYSKWGDRG